MTYPLVFVWDYAIPGWQGDAEIFFWDLWWIKYALLVLHTNPGLTTFIFYPNTVNLLSGDSGPVNGLISLPLQGLIGLIGSYNALYLFSFVMSGVGTYMLVRYLGCSRSAAFLAGAIFAFAPYRFAHSFGHFNLLTTEWIPFSVLYLLKAIRESRRVHFILACVFFFMTLYTEVYYALYLAILSAIMFIMHRSRVSTSVFIKKCLVIGLPVSLVLGAPVLWLGMDAISRHSLSNAIQAPWEVVWYSADLVAYFIPSVFNSFVGRYLLGIASHFTGNSSEYTTSLGYVTLFFVCYAIVKLRNVKEVRIWGVVMTTFLLLSLGPVLHIMGRTTFTEFNVSVPMPYILLYELLPLINVTRAVSRFAVIAMLAASVLVALAFTQANRRISLRLPRPYAKIIAPAILCLVLLEFAVAPIPLHVVPVSSFYQTLANERGDFAILDLPQDPRIGEQGADKAALTYMYYQTIHHKKIVGGGIPRAPENILEFTDRTPIVSNLIYPYKCAENCASPDIVSEDAATAQNVLAYYGIEYVILHKGLGMERNMNLDQHLLSVYFAGYPPVYEDEGISVYRVVTPDHFQPFLSLEYGWGPLEIFPTNMPTRWMSSDSGVTIFNPASTTIQLGFSAASLHGTRTLEVYADNQLVATLQVHVNHFETLRVNLSGTPGKNVSVRLHSREACETPKDLGINEDPRCLSMAFGSLSVTELEAGTSVPAKQYEPSPVFETSHIVHYPLVHVKDLIIGAQRITRIRS